MNATLAGTERSAIADSRRTVNVMSPLLQVDIRSKWAKTLTEENHSQRIHFVDTVSLMEYRCKELVGGAFYSTVFHLPNKGCNRFVFGRGRNDVLRNFRCCLPLHLPRQTRTERFDALLEWVAVQTTNVINDLYSLSDFNFYCSVPWTVLRYAAGLWNVSVFGDCSYALSCAGDGHQVVGIPEYALRYCGDADRNDDGRPLRMTY